MNTPQKFDSLAMLRLIANDCTLDLGPRFAHPRLIAHQTQVPIGGRSTIAVCSYRRIGSSFMVHLASLAHTTSKAGIIGITRQLAMEGREHGIRANSISPG
jgi:NAD(P)-dependent dehydrogenase (short-subunit alcohol dehydrogenase family)